MDAIALKHVEKLFDTGFKLAWNHKFHRAGYGHLPYPPTNGSRYDRFGSAPAIATRDFRPSNSGGSRPYSAGEGMRSRPQSSYEDKSRARSYRDDYRADTHRDNDLARRMEAFGGLGDDDDTMDAFSSAIKKARLDRYARRHANDDAGAPVHRRRSFMEDKDYDRDENDDRDYSARAAADILPSAPHPPPAPPTPPQQQAQAQAQSAQHRYQHQQLQQTHPPPPPHPPYPSLQQHQPLHPIHPQHDRFELHEQLEHQRAPPPPSQYPTTTYDRPAASMDFYTSGPSRTRAVTTDSEVGRLANRFNTESRSGPMHRPKAPPALTGPPMATGVSHGVPMGAGGGMGVMPMGPMSPNGPMAPLPPMMPMQGPPPPLMPPPLMGSMPIMSMAPIPHPSIMPEIPMMRRHLMEEDMFMGHEPLQRGGSFEQVPFSSYPVEDEYAFSSGAGGRRHRRRDEDASHAQEARRSEMAGLAGPGRGMDRVADWMEFVGNEPPGKDSDSVLNP
ncbi:hypothetical protein HMPREF1624_03271 [Sporothrix schenckii ATCC 58251]|uniref:Uncharacterized protein n=1 Tax=Sporothrix schenckii (strain ATCC 58251 / de Perez 2211183) TaxID=1391915 RepID=U7PWA6_SPOS1|nr:hypothetical protein HMPREF1624_03271 [Sporothrix schenckii ATCC 58251]